MFTLEEGGQETPHIGLKRDVSTRLHTHITQQYFQCDFLFPSLKKPTYYESASHKLSQLDMTQRGMVALS